MSTVTLTAFPFIAEGSEGTPGLWNSVYSILSSNIALLQSTNTVGPGSGNTLTITSDVSIGGLITAFNPVRIGVNSNLTNYLFLSDTSAARSNYILGSQAGGTADGLNIWDDSGQTMIVSFSKQSTRFYGPVVGFFTDTGGSSFNVRSYGAVGDNSTDDTAAIQTAIAAAFAAGGGFVTFPPAAYKITSTLQVPVALNSGQVVLKGSGMKTTSLRLSGSSSNYTYVDGRAVGVLFGSPNPDAAGAATQQTQYCGMEDLAVNGTALGSAVTAGNFSGIQFTEMQFGWLKNVIIETLPNASVGLYLRGATVTGGLGTGTTFQHVRMCYFTNLVIATIGSNSSSPSALMLQNADENDFYNCSFACASTQTLAAALSIPVVWIQLGRNNRFFGALYNGDDNNTSPYVGLQFGPPANASGVPNGSVLQNQDYGCVAEGHNIAVLFKLDSSGNLRGNSVLAFNPSISSSAFSDQNAGTGGFGNCVYAPMLNPPFWYFDGALPTPNILSLIGATPLAGATNFAALANASNTSVSQLSQLATGQILFLRLDSKTTLLDASQTGGSDLRLWGRQNLVGTDNSWVGFVREASLTRQITPPLGADVATTAWTIPTPLAVVAGSTTTPALTFASNASIGLRIASNILTSNFTLNITTGGINLPIGAATAPALQFSSDTDTGFRWAAQDQFDAITKGGLAMRWAPGQALVPSGSAAAPSLGFSSEVSLGLFRSSASIVGQSYGQLSLFSGSNTTPALGVSDISLGWYKSGTQTIAQSLGTFNLATNAVRLSMRTLAASSVTASAANTNVAVNEVVFTIGGASGASLCINSGGTTWIFNSVGSAANA
jgi:hypothetical protein